jgi:hypothetical protein
MADVLSILNPSVVTGIVSRIRTPGHVLSKFFGFEIGGSNVEQIMVPGRTYTYDIYDNVRTLARVRGPGVPAGTVAANPVGNNTVAVLRSAEKLNMDYEKLNVIRAIGENAGSYDRAGLKYHDKQAETLNQRQNNLREAAVAALFNGGKFYVYRQGDDSYVTYDSTTP